MQSKNIRARAYYASSQAGAVDFGRLQIARQQEAKSGWRLHESEILSDVRIWVKLSHH